MLNLDNMNGSVTQLVIAAMRWSSPWWWVWVTVAATTLSLINVLPLRVPPAKETEYGLFDVAKIGLRNVAVYALVALVLVYWPMMYVSTVSALGTSPDQGHRWFVDWVSRQVMLWCWMPVAGVVGGLALRVVAARYLTPWISSRVQRLVVRQEDDKQTDMRNEVGRLKARDFAPRAHYRAGQIFVGLDAQGKPAYLPTDLFRATHMQVVGPTRFGKGVVLGVMLEQAIAQGHSVVYIDPKADAFLPYIMADACERAGQRFVYIDLNSEDTRWAPFEGGTERDRRSRICNCFGLNNTGDGSDFYKSRERAILDTIMPRSGTSIAGLRAALEQRGEDGKPLKEHANRLYDSLVEFGMLPSLNPKKGGGNKIGEALKAGATVYVRGSLDDPTIKRATQTFISEVMQEARRLAPERGKHLTLAVDELKFMISQEISDALATIAGFRVNMLLLHQSIRDLRGPEDRSLNVEALEGGVIVNCQIKLLYRASDPETAEWASLLSGTKIVRTTKSASVEYNRFGGEAYTPKRMVADLEVPIISQNEMLSLSPRVGVLFAPERLAGVLYTCFVPADTKRVLYKRPEKGDASQDKPAELPPAIAAAAAVAAPASVPVAAPVPAPVPAAKSVAKAAPAPRTDAPAAAKSPRPEGGPDPSACKPPGGHGHPAGPGKSAGANHPAADLPKRADQPTAKPAGPKAHACVSAAASGSTVPSPVTPAAGAERISESNP